MTAVFRLAVGATVACTGGLAAYQQNRPSFRSTVDQVIVDVSVRDGSRQGAGLGPDDFELLDNGVVQAITAVEFDSQAIDLTIVAHSLALETLMGPGSAGRLPAFGGSGTLVGPIDALVAETTAQMRGDDHVEVVKADRRPPGLFMPIASQTANSRATLLDDVLTAMMLEPSQAGRRRLILVVAGAYADQSAVSPSLRLEVARRTEAVVHAVIMGQAIPAVDRVTVRPSRSPSGASSNRLSIEGVGSRALSQLADITGGRTYIGEPGTSPARVVVQAIDEFRSRYILRYSPTGVELPGWHRIEVRVKAGSFEVRHRTGYQITR